MTEQAIKLSDFLGTEDEEDFMEFDLTEVEEVLSNLESIDAIDLAHAELLQQQALRGADVITGYLGRLVKTIGFLETKVNSVKNKVSLEYKAPEGTRTTTDMKIWAANCSTDVEDIQNRLAKAKASKMVLDKKYDILIKSHHHYKDIAQGLRKTILGYGQTKEDAVPGYE
jgi:hypothetical protein